MTNSILGDYFGGGQGAGPSYAMRQQVKNILF